jgi:cytochrome c oxidase subunit 2
MERRTKKNIAVTDAIALTLVLIAIIGLIGGVYFYKQRENDLARKGIEIHITARQWAFEPKEIVVKKGQNVTLIITSNDVTHGFMIEALRINEIVHPGEIIKITLTFNETGIYEFRCSVYCGEPWLGSGIGHWMMRGVIKVID